MATNRTSSMSFPYPPDQLHRAGYDTLIEMCKPESISALPPTVSGRTKVTFFSWGEDILLQVSGHEHGSSVHITSKSALATQFIDYGRHRKNVAAVLDSLQRRLGAGQLLIPIT